MFTMLVACVVGLGSGWVAARLSVVCSRRLGDDGFLRRGIAFGRLLVSAEDEVVLVREYFRLWPALFAFLGKQLVAALSGMAPVLLAFAVLRLLAASWSSHSFSAMNDWEFAFCVSATLASVAGFLVARRA